jgi:hypothetical protein
MLSRKPPPPVLLRNLGGAGLPGDRAAGLAAGHAEGHVAGGGGGEGEGRGRGGGGG